MKSVGHYSAGIWTENNYVLDSDYFKESEEMLLTCG
jgi:hypothetical protein